MASTDVAGLNALLASLLEASPTPILALDREGCVTRANPATERVFGWTEQELLGKPTPCVPPELRVEVNELIARVLAGESFSDLQTVRRRKNGTLIDVSISAAPVRGPAGEITGCVASIADITERLAAEHALRESEQLHRLIVEQALEGIWLIDATATTTFANRQMAEMLGYQVDEMVGEHLFGFMDDEGAEIAKRNLERRQAGIAEQHEFKLLHRNGMPVWVTMSTAPILDEDDGLYRGALAVVTDVTERHAMELRDRELVALVEHSGDAIVSVDASTCLVTFWNAAAARLYGWTSKEILGQPITKFQPPELLHERRLLWDRVQRGETIEALETQIMHRSGARVDVLLTVSPVRDGAGQIVAISGIASDISARAQAERALRESEELFRTLVSHAPVGIFLADAKGRTTFVNQMGLDLGGVELDEALGYGWTRTLHADDRERVIREWATFTARGGTYAVEHRLRAPDGRISEVIGTATTLRDDAGEVHGYVGTIQDVTARREIERRMTDAQKLESLGVLAGGIAHDFNNLLVGVLGNAGLALAELPPDSPAREHVASIEVAARRAAELTGQMLAYSGRGRLHVEPLDLAAAVQEIGKLLESSVSKGARLDYRLERPLPAVQADATQLRQLVMNLIMNASDALEGEIGTITVQVAALEAEQRDLDAFSGGEHLPEGRYVLLEVADPGVGMSAETRDRIFDPFFTTKGVGRGLGLAAARGIVRGHGGAIQVVSEPGSGSRFRVLLPAVATPAVVPVEPDGEEQDMVGRAGRVLVVDDEEIVRRVAAAVLTNAGFDVVLAESGEEALDIVARDRNEIDVVLLDLLMPGIGGAETYERLHRLDPDVRVVVTSGFNEPEAMRGLNAYDSIGFAQKPYTPAELAGAVRSAFRRGAREPAPTR